MAARTTRIAVSASLVTFLLTAAPLHAQTLSPEERQIASYVDLHLNEALAFFERIVNIDSTTENLAGVREVGKAFGSEFEPLGFTARWLDMPAGMNRAGHLLAERQGSRGKRLLLIGHLDTVLKGERFVRDGAVARGTAVSDMKGGDVILLFALKALASTGALKDTRIVVMLTGDEEMQGAPLSVSRGDLVGAAKRSDLVLSFEPEVDGKATVGRRGISSWSLEVSGATGHSGQMFSAELGSGAIFEAARILNAFYDRLHTEQYLTFNPSVIVGGTDVTTNGWQGTASGKHNVVPQAVRVSGDLRFISEEQKAHAREVMRDIVSQNLPKTKAVITFEDEFPAMSVTPGNQALLADLDRVSRDLGFGAVEPLDPSQRGAGDISFVAPIISGLDGLGIGGGKAHAPGEYAELDRLPLLIKRAALLIYRLTR